MTAEFIVSYQGLEVRAVVRYITRIPSKVLNIYSSSQIKG